MFFLLFLFSCIVILVIWVALSWYVNKLVSCYLATKFKENKIPAFITFPFSAFLILFIASFFTFGWGWFVPYAMQPSYYEFKKMCELEPEIYQFKGGKIDKEYYNKLLSYFDTNFDEVLNGNKGDFESKKNTEIKDPNIEYYRYTNEKTFGSRIYASISLSIKKDKITGQILPLTEPYFYVEWDNNRDTLAGNENSGIWVKKGWEGCFTILNIDFKKFQQWEKTK